MHGEYDDAGNYVYPEGFNAETGEWLEGFDEQRAEWERDYAAAQSRWEAHKKQVAEMNALVIVPVEGAESASEDDEALSSVSEQPESAGTLADDESLAALREKLQGSAEE
jgi:small subunit ribosomal protein S1